MKTPGMAYLPGLQYELLKIFTSSFSDSCRVVISRSGVTDSLLAGKAVLAAMMPSDSIPAGLSVSRRFEDGPVWVATAGNKDVIKTINDWISHYSVSSEYTSLRKRFAPVCNPLNMAAAGKNSQTLSPYDNLVKKYSAMLGWDTGLFSALIWQESQFRIEATSPVGAVGIMQMIPATSAYWGGNVFDPEENMAAAVKYLQYLKTMFEDRCVPEDLHKFILGAYNAGHGRILDCIRYANAHELLCTEWKDIEEVLPKLGEEDITSDESVKLGVYSGVDETISYVRSVESIYEAYRSIRPE